MAVPFLPIMFPPRPPPPPWDQNAFLPPFPNSWRPPPYPGVFNPPFLPPPSPGNMPLPFMNPPHHNTSQMCNMFPWRPQKSCDSVRPMVFQPSHGSKRGQGRGPNRSNTRDKPPGAFECKPCAKEYRTEETYQTHLQLHVKCSSCEFEGSGKALKEHELFHILPDQLKFTSEQDIKKWKEERRKNFPTAENIARKKQLSDDKKERGESAVTPLHRYIQHLIGEDSGSARGTGRRGRGRGHGHVRGRPFHHRSQYQGPSKIKCSSSEDIEDQIVHNNVASGSDTVSLDLKDSTQTNSCDQDEILGAILADCVGSAGLVSLDVGRATVDPPLDDKPPNGANVVISDVSSEDMSSRKKGRVGVAACSKWKSRRQVKRNKKMNAPTGLKAVTFVRKPTLLEKLLAPEICREENALLQCVRHIVTNNFFISSSLHLETSGTVNTVTITESCDTSPQLASNSPRSCM